MSDNLRDRVAAVLEEHRQVASSCECGFDLGISAVTWHWRDHVADAVIEALNLRTDQVGTLTRYVTDWTNPHA